MRVSHIIVISFLCLLSYSKADAEIKEEDNVLVLTDKNFDEAINKYDKLLVEFYAPWCGHCKELAPHYAAAAKRLKEEEPPLYLAKVDATAETETAKKFEIEGFPTIRYFFRGQSTEYNGGRTEDEIVQWMKKKNGPSSSEIESLEDLEEFKKNNNVCVIFHGNNSTAGFSTFESTSSSYEDIGFGWISNTTVLKTLNQPEGQIILYKQFDEGESKYDGTPTQESLMNFIDIKSIPLVMNFDDKAAEHIFGKGHAGLFLYRDKDKHQTLETLIRTLAPKLKGRILVVITGIKEEMEEKLAEYVGMTDKDLPSVRIHDVKGEDIKKYSLKGDITEESVLSFVEQWESGKLQPEYKSEEIPTASDGPVLTVVGKSYNEVVNQADKDVLVELYAPWCGHCKELAPIYEGLAKKLKKYDHLVIAKMDATANEVEGLNIEGYPTLKFYPVGKKTTPIDFDGDKTEKGILQFLVKHSTQKIEEKDDL